jgi:urease accessory protein UreH
MKKALTVHEDTNMYGGAHTTNASIASRAALEGRDIVVHARHYDGQRYHYGTYRVTNLRETADGRIIGDTENGEMWEATSDTCRYAKTGQI